MARPDFRVKCFFTPQIIPGLDYAQGWKDAYQQAYFNITTPGVDTIPAVHQYIVGRSFDNNEHCRAPISYIEIVKHFILGSQAALIIESQSDRDFFEVVPNETVSFRLISGATQANPCVITSTNHQLSSGTNIRITGVLGMTELNNRSFRITVVNDNSFELHEVAAPYNNINSTSYHAYTSGGQVSYGGGDMMPRIAFPYRAWEVNLKAKDDSNFPTIPLFRGMRTRVQNITIGDKKITDQQDKLYRWWVELKSFDAWNLMNDRGASLWHQRANNKSDGYHLNFNTENHITFDAAITRIVAWMNMGRPTEDFPITYSYTEKGTSPYNRYLDEISYPNNEPMTIVDTADASTWEALSAILDYMGALQGEGRKFVPTLTVNAAGTIGTIDVDLGGYDKTHTFDETQGDTDFRTFTSMQWYDNGSGSHVPANLLGNGVAVTSPINQVKVMFTINQTGEYWIQFKLWKWSGSVWENVLTLPDSGYEYVKHDVNNVYNYKEFAFTTAQDAGTYTWTADVLSGNSSFTIATSGSGAYGVAAYALQGSNSEMDITTLRTFLQTRGACADMGASNCPDFVLGMCPGQRGLYPDAYSSGGTALTGTLTFTEGSATVTGVGTLFTSELIIGDAIRDAYGSLYHQILSITNNTTLTLTELYYDPYYPGIFAYPGASVKAGSPSSNEVVNAKYGIIGSRLLDYANVSQMSSWNTLCRKNSMRLYECSLNIDSSIREPINVHLEFVDGWTADVSGKYGKYYDPTTNEVIIFRCMQQTHILQNGRLKTIIEGFRV